MVKGHLFNTTEEIAGRNAENNTVTFENFLGCMELYEKCLNYCIYTQEDYFEEDSGNLEL